jgi:serine/threonine protein kinase/tetratricopeptide (TPR) repeat protein
VIGRRLAHYEIGKKLGQGGMGEVYRAHDTKLGRDVALKILPGEKAFDPERRARFEREARAVAALKHPNIVTIYSVEEFEGVPFLTMELVEGRSLAEAIPSDGMRLDRFFDYSIPLADAIGWAHDRGITHRDLKPSNVMIDPDGRVKVLDFGLAKVFAEAIDPERADTVVRTHDTAAGRILGTPAYMSPEQAEGKPIDSRSDIFSLGTVLYEMATGRRPFEGDTPISTISSILKDQPKSISDLKPTHPRELGRIVAHCLEKDRERRFQTAKDVRNELAGLRREVESGELETSADRTSRGGVASYAVWIAVGLVIVTAWYLLRERVHFDRSLPSPPGVATGSSVPTPPRRQMAVVLPFENLGPQEDAYFAAGVTEEITSRLASVSGLGVISRTSAANYSQSGKTVKQIGEDLGVGYILEGSVRWAKTADGKGRVRITPQLVRVSDDTPVWSDTYDREVTDIFDVQTEIANHVVDALGVTLQSGERERLGVQPTSNLEAYELYMRARTSTVAVYFAGFEEEIIRPLEKAVQLDPQFLAAWCELSQMHSLMYHADADRTEARLARAKSALDHADTIDSSSPLTQVARGFYYYYGFRDYDRALTEIEAALRQRPNDAEARWAAGLIYRRQGQWDQAVRACRESIELDPQNINTISVLADTYDSIRRPDLAMECYERALAIRFDNNVIAEMVLTSLRYDPGTAQARDLLARAKDARSSELTWSWANIYLQERNYAKVIQVVRQIDAPTVGMRTRADGFLAEVEAMRVGNEKARPVLERAANGLEELVKEEPGNASLRMGIASIKARLGRADDAVGQAKLAVDLLAKDKMTAPQALETLAVVYARTGRPDEAIDLITRVLAMNYDDPLTIYNLQKDPRWDSLRGNPKFQALLKSSS